jgi:uncharacterized protein (TIGR02271 family)
MDREYRGMVVEDDQGQIGTVVGVDNDPATGATRLIVEQQGGGQRTLSSDMFSVRNGRIHVHSSAMAGRVTDTRMAAQQPARLRQTAEELEVAPGEEVRLPIIREEVVVTTRQIERGGVRVHKLVNEREETVEQPITRDVVDVERITIGRVLQGDDVPRAHEEGDTLIIPILEEMLVVEKRLVLKEEVRITKRRTQEMEQVRVVLREEEVQIEPIEDMTSTLNPSDTTL